MSAVSTSSSTLKVPPPALTVLASGAAEDVMRCSSPEEPVKSPKGSGKNTLGLTLPGITVPGHCAHSVDSMLGGSHQQHRVQLAPPSPPRRIILEAEKTTIATTVTSMDFDNAAGVGIASHLLKTPPLICEQGPSAPSSPTTPSPGARSAKRPCPLQVDALQRLNLLSPNYVPPPLCTQMDSAGGKMPPVSPGYPTSDLGSSPRSSISASHYSALGINQANWSAFRDAYARRHGGSGGGGSSGDGDDSSEYGGGDHHLPARHSSFLLSPHQLLSPAPFSPFSDCGVADLHVASASATPYSSRSPNLSPSPVGRGGNNLHFSFEQIRSRSSLSNHGSNAPDNAGSNHHKLSTAAICHQPRSLDLDSRERSRSEGEALAGKDNCCTQRDDDERMDTGHGHGHSTLSVPASSTAAPHLHAGQKRRLQLQKSRRAEEEEEAALQNASSSSRRTGPLTATVSQQDSLPGPSASQMPSRQPTIEEPPPSPTLAELFQPGDLDKDRRRQVEDWIRQQTAALEAFRHSLVPPQQEANLLQVPTIVPQNSLEQLWPSPTASNSQAGPIRPATLWRRSRSESDVSAATSGTANSANGAGGRRQSHQPQQQQPQLMVPLNEATHVCEHCGQGFSMHDRLAKHIASRHRDRSASMNDEGNRVHKCQLCPKSFGRSDMLTRHMRLHTGLKPYACQLCGQVFSRSDHLSTHQRTHTGEKPYRCPQCNYAASRRDMITRHMRTHLMGDGTPAAFTELQIPPINELTLNPAPMPQMLAQPPPAPPPTASNSGAVSPQPPQRVITPTPPMTTTTAASTEFVHATTHQQMPLAAQPLLPPVPVPPPPTSAESAAAAASNLNEHLAKLISAAVANGAGGLLSSQLMFGSLGAQLPASLRRSSPNLLSAGDYPSAFRPPIGGAPPPPHCAPGTLSAALDPAIAAAAAAQVQQLISQQNAQRLSLPGSHGALPFLFRQNSFGGLGCAADNQQQQPRWQEQPK